MNLLELLTKYLLNGAAAASAFIISITSAALPSVVPTSLNVETNIVQTTNSSAQQLLQTYDIQHADAPKSDSNSSTSTGRSASGSAVTIEPAPAQPTTTPVSPCTMCPSRDAEAADNLCQTTCTPNYPCPVCRPYTAGGGPKPLMVCPEVMCVPLSE